RVRIHRATFCNANWSSITIERPTEPIKDAPQQSRTEPYLQRPSSCNKLHPGHQTVRLTKHHRDDTVIAEADDFALSNALSLRRAEAEDFADGSLWTDAFDRQSDDVGDRPAVLD